MEWVCVVPISIAKALGGVGGHLGFEQRRGLVYDRFISDNFGI
jgi:hypothetical protein